MLQPLGVKLLRPCFRREEQTPLRRKGIGIGVSGKRWERTQTECLRVLVTGPSP